MGRNVHIVAYDHDGHEYGADAWSQKFTEDSSLGDVVAKVAMLPTGEAKEIASAFWEEAQEKRWEPELRREDRRVIPYLAGTFGLASVGIAALLALLLWLILRTF
jgi:hypothetical protein